MGQRSQIYVKVDGKPEVANYYQWNYGDRMVSRARYGIEWIKTYMEFPFVFRRGSYNFEEFRRVWDVNFDYKAIKTSEDLLIEDNREYFERNFKRCVFGVDNDDGILLVDVDTKMKQIRYCFLDSSENNVMDAEQYMNWNMPEWEKPESSLLEAEAKGWCRSNIEELRDLAQVMTKSELDVFLRSEKW